MNKVLIVLLVLLICLSAYLCYCSYSKDILLQQCTIQLQNDINALDMANNKLKDYKNNMDSMNARYLELSYKNNNLDALNVQLQKEIDGYLPWTSNNMTFQMKRYSGLHNPTYSELMAFLKTDTTDTMPYIEKIFTCGTYSNRLIANASKVGIRSGIVGIGFTDGTYHAVNSFYTADKGMIFIDCTCQSNPDKGMRYMCQVDLIIGNTIKHTGLFSNVNILDTKIINDLQYRW
jgi:hypothetical protein